LGYGSAAYDRYLFSEGSFPITFSTDSTEAMRIDSSQRLLVGYTANISTAGHNAQIQTVGQGTADYHGATAAIIGFSNNSNGAYLNFGSGRSNTAGTFTKAENDDVVGQLQFCAADGTDMASQVAMISARLDGATGSNDTPGRLVFYTTVDGASGSTERMRLDNEGNLTVGTGAYPHTDKGIAFGEGSDRFGACIFKNTNGVGNGGTFSLTVRNDTGGWGGILTVLAHQDGSANYYTQKVYAVAGRNTSCTFTEIGSNSATPAPTFTMSCPTAGAMTATISIASGTASVSMTFNGGWGS